MRHGTQRPGGFESSLLKLERLAACRVDCGGSMDYLSWVCWELMGPPNDGGVRRIHGLRSIGLGRVALTVQASITMAYAGKRFCPGARISRTSRPWTELHDHGAGIEWTTNTLP